MSTEKAEGKRVEHTPGPFWYDAEYRQVCAKSTGKGGYEAGSSICVAVVKSWDGEPPADEAEGNGHLLAAAPAMLKALRKAKDLFPLGVGAVSLSDFTKANAGRCIRETRELFAEIDAALSLAEGRPQ